MSSFSLSPDFAVYRAAGLDLAAWFDSTDWLKDQFLVHGLKLELYSDTPGLRDAAEGVLAAFASRLPSGPARVRLWLTGQAGWALPAAAQILPPSSNEVVDVWKLHNLKETIARQGRLIHFVQAPMGGAASDPVAGTSLCWAAPDLAVAKPAVFANLLFQPVVLELLRGQGLYWVHAACVARAGRAVLLVGVSGSGKTTTSLNLVSNGFDFLSQDRVLLRVRSDGLDVLSFHEALAVTETSLDLVPGLRVRAGSPAPVAGKHQLNPGILFPQSLIDQAEPALILFLEIDGGDRTTVERIGPAAALRLLMPNSLLASLPALAQAHFEALSRLVADSTSYVVSLGRDFDAQPQLVRALLEMN